MRASSRSHISNSSHRSIPGSREGYKLLRKNRVNHENITNNRFATQAKEQVEKRQSSESNHLNKFEGVNHVLPYHNLSQLNNGLKTHIKKMNILADDKLENDTNRSQTSACSRKSSKIQNRSEVVGLTFNSYTGRVPGSIQELQWKLEQLIRLKLTKLAKSNPFPHSQRPSNQFQQQLQSLGKEVKQLRFTRSSKEVSQQVNDDLKAVSRKILMLEKIIAESNTESEVSLFNYADDEEILLSSKSSEKTPFNKQKQFHIIQKCQHFTEAICLVYARHWGQWQNQSTSWIPDVKYAYFNSANFSYQKPSSKDYQYFKHKNRTFRLNRQPVPRSTYSCEFLTYGMVPKYMYKEDNSLVSMERGTAGYGSTYKHDFKEPINKLAAKIDYKDLDCYQDKFKNLKVSFMRSCEKSSQQSSLPIKKLKINNQQQRILEMNEIDSNKRQGKDKKAIPSYNEIRYQKQLGNSATFLSQAKREFVRKISSANRSSMKDRNLNYFKNSYKMMLRA